MELLLDPHAWASLLALAALEIVLGIDNLVFIAILAARLPEHQRATARRFGLGLALLARLLLLGSIAWIAGLTTPVFSVYGQEFSWRDVILMAGGLYLIYKATVEMHERVESGGEDAAADPRGRQGVSLVAVILQISLIDVVFSLDSVITAVGMARHIEVMVAAVVLSMAVMIWAANPISEFIGRHPTIQMLAFAFILMVGIVLVADGLGAEIPKGYVYAAMAFSIFVEAMNILTRRKRRKLLRPAGEKLADLE
ncbi:MAG: TerC family protein [Alphaproteobacteria bacterium]|nr:TerC family protein [Alphaproteobacteria bacterium]